MTRGFYSNERIEIKHSPHSGIESKAQLDEKAIQHNCIKSFPWTIDGTTQSFQEVYQSWEAEREIRWQAEFNFEPLVSIIIPIYNPRLEELKLAVYSALSQSYKNIEVILIDDKSDVQYHIDWIIKLKETHTNITFIQKELNEGISATRNFGYKFSKGNFVSLLDQDDVLHPSAIYNMLIRTAESDKPNFVYSFETKLITKGPNLTNFLSKCEFSFINLLYFNYVCHFAMFERSLCEKIIEKEGELFRSETDGAEDHDLFLRFSQLESFKPACVPIFLYYWRISEKSTAGNIDNKPSAREACTKAVSRVVAKKLTDSFKIIAPEELSPYRSHHEIQFDANIILSDQLESISFGQSPHLYKDTHKPIKQVLQGSLNQNLNLDLGAPNFFSKLHENMQKCTKSYVLLFHNCVTDISKQGLEIALGLLNHIEDLSSVGFSMAPDNTKPYSVIESIRVLSSFRLLEVPGRNSFFALTTLHNKRGFGFETRETFANSVQAMVVKREDYMSKGGFDAGACPRFFADLDLGLKLHQDGKKHICLGLGHAKHHKNLNSRNFGQGHPEESIIMNRHSQALARLRLFSLCYDFSYFSNQILATLHKADRINKLWTD